MIKALCFRVLTIILLIFLSGCYTKSDILKRQLISEPKYNTTVITSQGDQFEFQRISKRTLVRGDYLQGILIDGRFVKIPVSDVAEMNGEKFDTSTPIYLYAFGGIIILSAMWVLMTSGL